MRTVSVPLLAAQRVSPQRPRVRVLVRDKQPRPGVVGSQGTANVGSSVCRSLAAGRIFVAALDTAGCIRVREVTDPTVLAAGSGWGHYPDDYTEVIAAAGALPWPDGDVAISENSGTLRLFYVKADGTEILTVSRAAVGGSWGSSSTVGAVSGGATGYRFYLAAGGHDDVWFTIGRAGYRYVYFSRYSGGAWGAWTYVQYIVEGGGEYTTCYGLAVQWDSLISQYCVVASLDRAGTGDGRLVAAWWDPGIPGIHDWRAIVPPGYPAVGFVPWRPALVKTSFALGYLWLLSYWDTFASGLTSWSVPMCLVSRDFDHWSYKIPLTAVNYWDYKRINLVEWWSVVYGHLVNQAVDVDIYWANNPAMDLTVLQPAVLRYRVSEAPERGELWVELDNRGGAYDGLAPLRPLAQVIVDQGLNTSSGDVRVESRPFYLWSQSLVREMGRNLVRLYCVDGWQLLRMWRPDCTIEWVGKTLLWCIAELAARVGNWKVVSDGSVRWSEVLNYLTVAASYDDVTERWFIRSVGRWLAAGEDVVMFGSEMSGLTILHHLLGLVGGAARFGNGDDREVLYIFVPEAQGPAPAAVHTYADGEVLSLQSVKGFAWPTRVLVSGSGAGVELWASEAAQTLGMDVLQMQYGSQWSTIAQLALMAYGLVDDGAARAAGGFIKTRPNVGLELFDVILFSDSKAGGGLTSLRRRVNGLVMEYDPRAHVWEQTVSVEAV